MTQDCNNCLIGDLTPQERCYTCLVWGLDDDGCFVVVDHKNWIDKNEL